MAIISIAALCGDIDEHTVGYDTPTFTTMHPADWAELAHYFIRYPNNLLDLAQPSFSGIPIITDADMPRGTWYLGPRTNG